jgi:hypothetical protein
MNFHDPSEVFRFLTMTGRDWATNPEGTIEWSWVPGKEARNYDGSPAPNPDREWVLQKKAHINGKNRFTNFWGYVRG